MARAALSLVSDTRAHRATGRQTAPGRLKRLAAALMLPREHGAWAMLLMAYLLGTAAAGWSGWASLLLLASALLLFSSSRPLELVLQTTLALREANPQGSEATEARERRRQATVRLAAYLALGGGAGVLLLLLYQRWTLVPLGAAAGAVLAAQLVLRRYRLDRATMARLLSIAALSAAGPAAYYAATGALDQRAAAAGLLAFLYSGASVFYVRLYYRPPSRQKPGRGVDDRARAEVDLGLYLALAATATVAISTLGWLPPLGVLTLTPLAAKAAWAVARRGRRPTLRQIGFAEIGHAVLFALLAIAAMALWK